MTPLAALLLMTPVACAAPPPVPPPPAVVIVAPSRSGEPHLDVRRDGRALAVRALYTRDGTAPAETLTYHLVVERVGRSRSTNRQSGTVTVDSSGTHELSATTVSVAHGDRLTVHLIVSDAAGDVVGTADYTADITI